VLEKNTPWYTPEKKTCKRVLKNCAEPLHPTFCAPELPYLFTAGGVAGRAARSQSRLGGI
jgi:hypothetical protein